jgi:Flp pilus assembly protein TadG
VARSRRGESGQATLELVLLAIPLLALFLLAVAFGRWGEAKGVISDAADAAAQAASVTSGGPDAQAAAQQAAAGVIGSHQIECASPGVVVTLGVVPGGTETATVSCTASAAQVLLPGLPGNLRLSGTETAVVRPYRSGPGI